MALFESYDRREPQILAVLKNYGINTIEECADICKAKGLDRIVAITDSIMAAGLPDGNYHLGVNDVVVVDGDAKLASNGTRAGSTLTQDVALKNMRRWLPYSLEEILPTLSENPAKEMGLWDRKGSIETGKDADVVLLDENDNVVHVFARGKQVK